MTGCFLLSLEELIYVSILLLFSLLTYPTKRLDPVSMTDWRETFSTRTLSTDADVFPVFERQGFFIDRFCWRLLLNDSLFPFCEFQNGISQLFFLFFYCLWRQPTLTSITHYAATFQDDPKLHLMFRLLSPPLRLSSNFVYRVILYCRWLLAKWKILVPYTDDDSMYFVVLLSRWNATWKYDQCWV